MLLVVGLGNPGPEYARNRHNVGFMAADAIHARHRFQPWRAKFQGEIADGQIGGDKVLLLKPMTYMNDSGRAVQQAMQFYKLKPEDVVVIHDELDLAAGKIRIKQGGGAAGHNGIRDIAENVGPDFRRLRVGIGHPGDKERVLGHVLKDFAKADQDWLGPLLDAIAENAALLAAGQDSKFMSKVTLAARPPQSAETTAKDEDKNGL